MVHVIPDVFNGMKKSYTSKNGYDVAEFAVYFVNHLKVATKNALAHSPCSPRTGSL